MRKSSFVFFLASIALGFAFIPVSDVQAITTEAECLAASGVCQVTATCASDRHVAQPVATEGCNDNWIQKFCCLPGAPVAPTGLTDDACAAKYAGGVCRNETPSALCNPGESPTVDLCTAGPTNARRCCVPPGSSTSPVSSTGAPTQVTGPTLGDYQLLEQIPGSNRSTGRLNTYLEDIYRFAFWTVGISVVFMLTIGGFMYLTSAGNTSRMESAKTVIFDAILGLVLALVAWLFLYVINPDLVKVRLPSVSITPTTPTAPPVTPTAPPVTPPTSTGSGSSQTFAQRLQAGSPGVQLSGSGSCSSSSGAVSPASSIAQAASGSSVTVCQANCPGSGLCSGSTRLSDTMLGAIISVGAQYPLTVTSFTGGAHSNNSVHYRGSAVDVRPSAPKAQWPEIQAAFRQTGARAICDIWDTVRKANISIPCNDSRADHIHAQW